MVPDDRYYTDDHEWLQVEGDTGIVGITDFAQEELGDVVYVELPEPGTEFEQGQEMGTIESVKAVSSLYLPVSGSILEVNQDLEERPELVNEEPLGDGWLVKLEIRNAGEVEALLDAPAYQEKISAE